MPSQVAAPPERRGRGRGQCPSSIAGDLVSCDSQTGDWLVRNTNWFGVIDNTLVVVNCPPNYCFYNTSSPYVRIPQNISSDPAEGWAPAINSDPVVCVRCEDDTRGWLYYLLAIYVPVFTFFMFIVVFNVCFTTGPLNAFILYAQLISTTFNQLYKPIDGYQRAYRTLYGVFNLQFIASLLPAFCIGKDLDSLNIIALKYLEAVFPLLTIVGIVVGSGRVANSLVHAFAAFILLSYTRFCLVTTYILTPIPLWNIAMETVGDRPYFAGQHRFSDLSYILPNVIPACIVLVTFIAIPPILLLDFKMRWIESAIFKSPALTRWYPKVGIGIVLDAFQGCFHDDKRYFAGLYFTLRLPVASASTVSSDSGLVMTDDVLEVTPVLMQSPMSPLASMVSEGSTVEKAPSEVGRNEPVSVEVSTVTSATAVSEAVSTQAVAAKFGLHFDSRTGVLDPVALVGCRVSVSEKHDKIKLGPCQPSKHVLNHSQKSMQRHCSEQVFVHSDGVRRQWISYSVSKGALYCLPCLLFSDATLRGEHWRANQGNAFTTNGFCNWKKQYSAVLKHESSCAHRNAIVSQALFLQDDTVQQAFARADSVDNARKRAIVAKNRTVLERIVKVLMLLGRQGLPIRGHREMMTDSMTNTGNFLETLKLLSTYDPPLQEHLEKIIERHQSASEGSSGQKGRGSVLTFMSYKSQNKLISIINEHITCTIVKAIHNCRAWSLMADTTPDISHHEQVSICVRIVHLNGHVSEHLLACQRAHAGTTAEDLYGVIMSVLKLRDVSFDKLIAQAYDGASNMSGCYNGLQSLIQTRINPNILYVHCYAHCLNLVISDAAATSVDVVTLFGNLETLYVLFTRSQKVHGLFEEVQRSQGCAIRSLKRLNTVRWSAREMCLSTFLERYECILLTLNQIQTEVSFDLKHRSEAAGLLSSIQTREFLATAFLFQEIFAKTGPLSRYLQSVNMDYAKALAMIDSVIASLERMRSAPQDIIDIMERSVQDSSSIQWKTTRVSRRMCRNTEDGEVLETSEESWQRKTFFVALDTIIASMRRRFDKNRSLFETLALFAPGNFTDLVKSGKSAQDLHCNVAEFCDKFQLNSNQCLQELLSFAAVYDQFHTPSSTSHRMDVEDITLTDLLSDETNDDGTTGVDQQIDPADQVLANWSFLDALNLLCNPAYHLYDAFPEYVLQQVLVTVFAVFLSIQRPYKMHSLNFLDSLLLLNMAVINILGIYSLATDQLTPSASSSSTLTSVFAIQLREDLLSHLVYNVQLVHKLGFATSAKQFRKYNNIKFENPSKRPMESATIGSELYEVRFEDMTIGIIDTPGFGDTRGFEIDKQNVKNIVDKVNGVEYINCICFVINGRQARVTPPFQYVVSEISAVLPKMSVKNMVVLLTNTRDETEANINMKEVTSFLGGEIMQENIFCLENPYCQLDKLRNKKPDLPREEIATCRFEG
ncbi:hypothetical protein EMCRGX_G008703 [Ephydatia muelleri]